MATRPSDAPDTAVRQPDDPETGWLIEIPEGSGGPLWWTGEEYTADSLEAVRFARREDAERIIASFGGGSMVATEHEWVAGRAVRSLAPPCEACGEESEGRSLDDIPLCGRCGSALEAESQRDALADQLTRTREETNGRISDLLAEVGRLRKENAYLQEQRAAAETACDNRERERRAVEEQRDALADALLDFLNNAGTGEELVAQAEAALRKSGRLA